MLCSNAQYTPQALLIGSNRSGLAAGLCSASHSSKSRVFTFLFLVINFSLELSLNVTCWLTRKMLNQALQQIYLKTYNQQYYRLCCTPCTPFRASLVPIHSRCTSPPLSLATLPAISDQHHDSWFICNLEAFLFPLFRPNYPISWAGPYAVLLLLLHTLQYNSHAVSYLLLPHKQAKCYNPVSLPSFSFPSIQTQTHTSGPCLFHTYSVLSTANTLNGPFAKRENPVHSLSLPFDLKKNRNFGSPEHPTWWAF